MFGTPSWRLCDQERYSRPASCTVFTSDGWSGPESCPSPSRHEIVSSPTLSSGRSSGDQRARISIVRGVVVDSLIFGLRSPVGCMPRTIAPTPSASARRVRVPRTAPTLGRWAVPVPTLAPLARLRSLPDGKHVWQFTYLRLVFQGTGCMRSWINGAGKSRSWPGRRGRRRARQ